MRLSADRNDVAFSPLAYKAKAFLDGKFIPHTITADEEKGEIIKYVKDENGRFVLYKDEDGDTRLKTEKLIGNVTIKIEGEN